MNNISTLMVLTSVHHRCIPLRIKHNQYQTYRTVHSYLQSNENDTDRVNIEALRPVRHLYASCMALYRLMESATTKNRITFRQIAANSRYYHSRLAEEIEKPNQAGVRPQVDGKDYGQILKELEDLELCMTDWEFQNTSRNTLHWVENKWDYASSPLFIVLPSNLCSWTDSDPSTHQFRLYFLCDNRKQKGLSKNMPQHVHLANHQGYSLRRPKEFFQKYGGHVLRILRMIRLGYSYDLYEVPPLDSFNILWNCDSDTLDSHLSKDTIKLLVDKAIAHYQDFSPPKWEPSLGLTRGDILAIKTYLVLQDGDNSEGNLHRYIDRLQKVFWRCKAHFLQPQHDPGYRSSLEEFVCSHGGHFNVQQATLRVELSSKIEADQFYNHLAEALYIFDISLRLKWKLTRSDVETLCEAIAHTGTVVLELDSITPEIHPEGHQYILRNFFKEMILKNKLKVISLLNYPRPQEQRMYLGAFSVKSKIPSARSSHSWVELRMDLEKFSKVLAEAEAAPGYNRAVEELLSVKEKHGLSADTTVTVYDDKWITVFDLQKEAVCEVYSQDDVCPKAVRTTGSLSKLTVDLIDLEFDKDFFHMERTNPGLQEFNVSYHGHSMFYSIEHIVNTWHRSSSPFRLALIDRLVDTQGRVVAQLEAQGCDGELAGSAIIDVQDLDTKFPLCRQKDLDASLDIRLLRWDCDHVFSQLSDYSASFLNMATQQHPSVLTLFTLDISRLTRTGFASVQHIFARSDLEYLKIICTPIASELHDAIGQVLASLQWSTLKSLVLFGDSIDEWIKLWPTPVGSQISCFTIQGSGSAPQELSHLSVLWIHRLVYVSPLVMMHITDVQLQDYLDWVLMVDSMDPLLFQTFSLCSITSGQFRSCQIAVDHYKSAFPIRPENERPFDT